MYVCYRNYIVIIDLPAAVFKGQVMKQHQFRSAPHTPKKKIQNCIKISHFFVKTYVFQSELSILHKNNIDFICTFTEFNTSLNPTSEHPSITLEMDLV